MIDPQALAAIQSGDRSALEALLEAGLDPAACDSRGVGLLHHAAAAGELALVELLLERGADPQQASRVGNDPLMAAAGLGRRAVVERLLAAGASADRRNKWGFSAFDWAAWAPNPSEIRTLFS